MDGLYWKTLLQWMIWGYHHLRKHPYIHTDIVDRCWYEIWHQNIDSKGADTVADHGPIHLGTEVATIRLCGLLCSDQRLSDVPRMGSTAFHPVDGSEIWRSPGWGWLVCFPDIYLLVFIHPRWFFPEFGSINSISLNKVNSHPAGTSTDINWPAWSTLVSWRHIHHIMY